MARERERHVKDRCGVNTAPQDDASSGTIAQGRPTQETSSIAMPADILAGRGRDGRQVLEDRIANASRVVAELLEHDEAYLPIFLRLEAAIKEAEARRAALERARAVFANSPRMRSGPAPRP